MNATIRSILNGAGVNRVTRMANSSKRFVSFRRRKRDTNSKRSVEATSVLSAFVVIATFLPIATIATVVNLSISQSPAVAATGEIYTVAGNGGFGGYSGDNGPARSAELNNPYDVAIASNDDIYISDAFNNVIRKIEADTGIISTAVGDGNSGNSGDGGAATSAMISPLSIVMDSNDNLYISSGSRVRKVNTNTGEITTFAGTGISGHAGDGGPATSAQINPGHLAIDESDNLYISGRTSGFFGTSRYIRKVATTTGVITTIAGNGANGQIGNRVDGVAATASGMEPTAIAVNSVGDVYFVENSDVTIRKIDAVTGVVTSVSAGDGTEGDIGDGGPLSAAKFGTYNDTGYLGSLGMKFDAADNLYVSDEGQHRLRKVDVGTTTVHTIAGNGSTDFSGDGGPAISAGLPYPGGIDLDSSGNVFVAGAAERVREVMATDAPPVGGFPPMPDPIGGPITSRETKGGGNPAQNYVPCDKGYPVNCATGNFWHTFTDIDIPGRGVPLHLERTYNSLDAAKDSLFGYGWSSSYDMKLDYDSGSGEVTIFQENGSEVVFDDDGAGNFIGLARTHATLVHNGDGTWTFERRERDTFKFDSTGRLIGQTDLNGYTTTISYPSATSMVVTEPGGRTLTFTLSAGHVTGVTDPAGRSLFYIYSGSNLTEVIDVNGGHTQFTYDGSHRMLTMRSPRFYGDTTTTPSPVVTNHYDSEGRVDWQTDPLGRETTFEYDGDLESDLEVTITDPAGKVEIHEYHHGELISLTKAAGTASEATWTYGYDQQIAAISSVTDPNGHTKSYVYDADGNLTTATDASGNAKSYTYDNLNNVLTSTDENGVTSEFTYDTAGNLLTESHPLITGSSVEDEVTSYVYGDSSHPGDITSVSNPLGQSTSFTYNTYGDVTSSKDAMGNKTTYAYNGPTSIGWVMSTVSPRGNVPGGNPSQFTTTYTRNNRGQALTVKDPLWDAGSPTLHISTNTYDADGNLLSKTDGSGNTTSNTYDAAGQLITVTKPDSTTTHNSFYPDGSLHTQTDGRGKVTSYAYDPIGNISSVTDPLNRTTSYVSDPVGNLLKKIDPSGTCTGTPVGCTSFSYDTTDRLTGVTYSDGTTPNVTYGYDDEGQRTSMTDGSGTSTYSYDSLGRMTSYENGNGQTVGYAYDRASRVTKIEYPNGEDVTRTYDAAGRFTSVTDWLGKTNRFTYDPDNNLTSIQSGNGVASARSFDRANQLTSINIGKGATATFSYTRSGNGSVTGTSTTGLSPASESFGYDAKNRLNSYNGNTLTYDNSDNLTTMADGSTLTYDDASQILTKTLGGTTTNYSYGNRGERTVAGSNTYGYDQASRLVNVNSGAATYAYDGDDLRTLKTVGANTQHFAYDIVDGLSKMLTDGTNYYIYGPAGLVVEQINGTTPTYLHQDQLGSTRVLTNSSRVVIGTYSYDPYGVASHTGSGSAPFQYAGQYADAESGLIWMRARYYDPDTGSFMTVDPLNAMTKDYYRYTAGNPVNSSDPSGLWRVPGTSWCIGDCTPDTPEEKEAKRIKKEVEKGQKKILKYAEKYYDSHSKHGLQPGSKEQAVFGDIQKAVTHYQTATKCLGDDTDPQECGKALIESLQSVAGLSTYSPFSGMLFAVINDLLEFVTDTFDIVGQALEGSPAAYFGSPCNSSVYT